MKVVKLLTVSEKFLTATKFRSFQFQEQFGPSFDADWESPLSIFEHFFDGELQDHIILESNKYAALFGVDLNVIASELKAFIGLLIVMGFHQLPSMRLYWSSNENFRVSKVGVL